MTEILLIEVYVKHSYFGKDLRVGLRMTVIHFFKILYDVFTFRTKQSARNTPNKDSLSRDLLVHKLNPASIERQMDWELKWQVPQYLTE